MRIVAMIVCRENGEVNRGVCSSGSWELYLSQNTPGTLASLGVKKGTKKYSKSRPTSAWVTQADTLLPALILTMEGREE